MGRVTNTLSLFLITSITAPLVACGSKGTTPGTPLVASIRLAPSSGSIDIGTTLQFIATLQAANQVPVTAPVTFQSDNPAVLTVANSGLACAGSWDSAAIPVQCNPGSEGMANVTASSSGITSAPVTVYIHQHIDQITVTALPPSPGSPPPGVCYTALATSATTAHDRGYSATAVSHGADITPTVGPFNWSSTLTQVASVTATNTSAGIPNGQALATAKAPGITQIFASIGGANSTPLNFTTCAVQSIDLTVGSSGGTTILANSGTSTTITATVKDTEQNTLPTPPLTWSSSQPAVAAVSTAGAVTGSTAGGASITASCIPPTCNINMVPMQAVYPPVPITAHFAGTAGTFSAYVTSTGCGTTLNCSTALVPIGGTPPAHLAGLLLSGTPNSLLFNPTGSVAFLGSSKGLMQVSVTANPPTLTTTSNVTGKVLAVSPDGKKVVVSDTQSPVNQVFVFDTSNNSSANFLISGATAAGFSPDNLKAYILAATKLYVYSSEAPLKTISLPASMTATDVALLGTGGFAYIGGTAASGGQIMVRNTCDDSISVDPSTSAQQLVPTPGPPLFLRPLPGESFIALDPPGVDIITGTVSARTNHPVPGDTGCPIPFPQGYLGITNTVSSQGLGQGLFNPVGFAVSSDGQKAYVAIQNTSSIVVLDIPSGNISSIGLGGNPSPLAMSLSPDGTSLYVSTSDLKVHVISTVSGSDTDQVSLVPAGSSPPTTVLCAINTGGPAPDCLPDLLAVKP